MNKIERTMVFILMLIMIVATLVAFNKILNSNGVWQVFWIFIATLIMQEVYSKWAIYVVKRHVIIVERIKKYEEENKEK